MLETTADTLAAAVASFMPEAVAARSAAKEAAAETAKAKEEEQVAVASEVEAEIRLRSSFANVEVAEEDALKKMRASVALREESDSKMVAARAFLAAAAAASQAQDAAEAGVERAQQELENASVVMQDAARQEAATALAARELLRSSASGVATPEEAVRGMDMHLASEVRVAEAARTSGVATAKLASARSRRDEMAAEVAERTSAAQAVTAAAASAMAAAASAEEAAGLAREAAALAEQESAAAEERLAGTRAALAAAQGEAEAAQKRRELARSVVAERMAVAQRTEAVAATARETLRSWETLLGELGLDPVDDGSAVARAPPERLQPGQKDHEAIVARWLADSICAAKPRAAGMPRGVDAMLGASSPRILELLESIATLRTRARAQHAAVAFFKEMLLQSHAGPWECSVCLDDEVPVARRMILPCAHVFCDECVASAPSCPLCRAPVREEEGGVMRVAEPGTWNSTLSEADRRRWGHHGSKLVAVARTITDVLADDPTAALLVFLQWADLHARIAGAFRDFGIEFAELGGSAHCRGRTISRFQAGEDPRVLLLNLEDSASGTNLTRASHVLLVHPMHAASPQTARAYEAQAIGRALRHGQQRQVVVHRFVTQATVEQRITELWAAELWERRPRLVELCPEEEEEEEDGEETRRLEAALGCRPRELRGASAAELWGRLDGLGAAALRTACGALGLPHTGAKEKLKQRLMGSHSKRPV